MNLYVDALLSNTYDKAHLNKGKKLFCDLFLVLHVYLCVPSGTCVVVSL